MRYRLAFAVAALASLCSFGTPALSASVADQCYAFVQGNVPWDYAGSTTWNPANVERLCGATSRSAEPGRCFDRVMNGNIDWGGGTQWQWENALELCASTSNANNTIACFSSQVSGGETWQQAISACKYAEAPAPAPGGGPCYDYVQGNIPWNYDGNTDWNPANVENLCAGTSKHAEPGRCFDQVMNGGNVDWGGGTNWEWQNAINLCQGTNNARNTIKCFRNKIAGGDGWPQAIEACN